MKWMEKYLQDETNLYLGSISWYIHKTMRICIHILNLLTSAEGIGI